MSPQPTAAEFARLDEKTAGAIKNLGEKMEAWVKAFEAHVAEDHELKREFTDQQRQFYRMTASLEAISKQLAEISLGFSRTVVENTTAMALMRADVETLKADKAQRDRDSIRKEILYKRWMGVVGAASSVAGVVAGHFWPK